MVRCKFKCQSVTEQVGWGEHKTLFSAEFSPVSGGSDENKRFWDATPSGSFEIETVKEMPFTVGADYYLDISEAPAS